ncbi:MAG: hydroxymethylglutaryl-CoA lyase, partial [Rhizorhabdus sp.]
MPVAAVEIVEVAPRDGLQNEAEIVGIDDKLELIARAIAGGARRIEVGSFVNPARVPQMADTDQLAMRLPEVAGVTYLGLVLNMRGADRALATRIHELGAVCIATDSFAMRNQGQTSAGSVAAALGIVEHARAAGRSAQVTIGAAFGCPFEGEVDPDRVVAMAAELAAGNPREIGLADTIGVAAPPQVAELVTRVAQVVAPIPVRIHLHNTRNTGLANVWAAVLAGATTIDASIGGLGGCPFAPGAAGNVPTEDVVYMLERSGVNTGLDLDALIDTARWFTDVMGRPL